MSLPFLLEIGTEEIPDWMIPSALENLRLLFEKLANPTRIDHHGRHAAPSGAACRRVARQTGRQRRARHGTGEIGARAGGGGVCAQAGRQARRSRDRNHSQGRILFVHSQGSGAADQRYSGRSASRPSSCRSISPRRCTGPSRADRASSGRSAGSWRCWARKSCRSNWRASIPAR